jgi:hypothetical protein
MKAQLAKTCYWRSTRIGIFQIVGDSKYEIVSRGECPVCHAFNIPVILVNDHETMGIHRRFGTDFDCEGSFQSCVS